VDRGPEEEDVEVNRMNCWEFHKCGKEPGGKNSEASKNCPASTPGRYDGINNGMYAGRFCWALAGTLCDCGGQLDGGYATKLMVCLNCDFFKQVNEEEGRFFILSPSKAEGMIGKKI